MFTCPCCGYRMFAGPPGSYELCHVCFWEDDPIQLLDPWYAGGANGPSLLEAQANFVLFGVCEENAKSHVRGVQPDDSKDESWRPVEEADRARVRLPKDLPSQDESFDIADWYYWLGPADNSEG